MHDLLLQFMKFNTHNGSGSITKPKQLLAFLNIGAASPSFITFAHYL